MLHLSSVGGQTRDQEDRRAKWKREGGMAWQVKEGVIERVKEGGKGGVCAHLLCVSCRSAGAEADLFPQ